jgi:hypothetical protein
MRAQSINNKNEVIGKDIFLSDKRKYILFCIYSICFIILGLLLDTPQNIMRGLYCIIVEPDVLITDYFVIGGVGATFVNSGMLMLMTVLILYLFKIEFTGLSIVAIYLMGGFALFGKNIFNVWLILIGTLIYIKLKKESVGRVIYVAFFGTSLAPIISEICFGMEISIWFRIILCIVAGLSIGLLLPPLSSHVFHIHKGFNLYNVGFAAGILGTIYVSIFRSYGFVTYSKLIWSKGFPLNLSIFLIVYFLSMLVLGYFLNGRSIRKVVNIFRYSGVAGSDYVKKEGFGAALMNMGLNGLFSMAYLFLIGGDLNGPTIGGILTVMCFGAYGKHLKNIAPVLVGVIIGGLTKTWSIDDPHIQLAALFGTSLAPISGHYGWFMGIIAGFINSSVVLNSGILHGGMNLYNTGFAAGIVSAVLLPILETFTRKKNKEPDYPYE